ncbi:MAG TPA: CBS domain-containing protein [Stellaceae bacterium]|jgi:CBS domain-containing protein|nr:CBS domain-containing protein [Stellaceae bacterium]
MRAIDVMTTNVITVTPDMPVQQLAELLCRHGISGVPVVDAAGALVGIVSEGDLLHRAETGTERRTERRRTRWLDSLASDRELARDYIKSHARAVHELMTRDVITVDESAELSRIADLLETKRIKRVPVVRDGEVVGIVSRANLVRALAAAGAAKDAETCTDDRTIRRNLLAELQTQEWAKIWASDIVVRDKTVHVWYGDEQTPEERQALRVAAENTVGVRAIEEHVVPTPITPPL